MADFDSEHVVRQEQTSDGNGPEIHVDHDGTPSDDEEDCCDADESSVPKSNRIPKLDTADANGEADNHVLEISISRGRNLHEVAYNTRSREIKSFRCVQRLFRV